MRIHYLQHVPFEGVAYIGQWAKLSSCSLTGTALFKNAPFPDLSTLDCLVILGGPMGVYDSSAYNWLNREKHYIEQALRMNKLILDFFNTAV